MSNYHEPVLKTQILQHLCLKAGSRVIDCTIGAAGHAESMLQQISPTGLLLGLDRDPTALEIAKTRLAAFKKQVTLVNTNFDCVSKVATEQNFLPVQAILADIGVSSMQLNQPQRGFSFNQDGPLDMRMNQQATQSAATLINNLTEKELADIIYRYGEERKSRKIARAIVKARPINTTLALANVVKKALAGRPYQKIHPATRTFQAFRIAVNDELGALERFLPQAVQLLAPGGHLAIISFHSLEDRLIKHFFKQEATDCICPPQQLLCNCQHKARVKIITKKPIVATKQEVLTNPRARSAKLRVIQRKESN